MIYKPDDLISDLSKRLDYSPDIIESVYYSIFENILFKIKHPNKHLAFIVKGLGTFRFRRKKLVETQDRLNRIIEKGEFHPNKKYKRYIDDLVELYEKYIEDNQIPYSLAEKRRMEKEKAISKKSI